jgi:hypothetical protein
MRPTDIAIADIAHALSMLCRYGGHIRRHYSVAEHSLNVMSMVDPLYAREALMHDATEAFVGDVVQPIKNILPEYAAIEMRVQLAIAKRFELSLSPYITPPQVKKADNVIRLYEMAELMPGCEMLYETAANAGWTGLAPLPDWGNVESAFLRECKRLNIW